MNILIPALTIYAITFLICSSQVALPLRIAFRWGVGCIPYLKHWFTLHDGRMTILGDEDHDEAIRGYDFISCRMCVGLWVSLEAAPWEILLPAYGLSYLFAKLEQP